MANLPFQIHLVTASLHKRNKRNKENVGLPEKDWSEDAATLAGKTN